MVQVVKYLGFLISFTILCNCYSQDMSKSKSTYETTLSKLGPKITKDIYDLTQLNSSKSILSAKVVVLSSKKGRQFFLSLCDNENPSNITANIAEEDLDKINKAIEALIIDSKKDSSENLDYRERYFITNDGFKVGYFQKGKDQTFFIDLNDQKSEDTYYFDNFKVVIETICVAIVHIVLQDSVY